MKIPGGWGALRRTFAIRDYRLFVIGNLTANVGLWAQRVALGWLTWDLTHSTAWLGGIAIAESLPTLALAPIAGAVVDRVDYFKLLRCTQALALSYAVAMCVLTLADLMSIWLLLVIVLIRGSVTSFNRPSRMTVIFTMVGRDMLASAVAVNSIIFNVSRFVGPAIGGGLIVAVGVGWTFAASATLFLVFSVMLHLIHTRVSPPPERERKSMLVETVEGLRYMTRHPGIRVQMIILIGIGFLAKPLSDLLPGFVGEVFHRGPDGLAILMSAQGIGAMAGASWMASRGKGITGMTAFTIAGILVVAGGLLLFAATPSFWVACLLIVPLGMFFIVMNVANQTLIQSAADPAFRGRVISNYGLVHQGVPALGALLMGGIAEFVGLRWPVAMGAVLCIVLWYWAWRQRRPLAQALETDPAAPARAEGTA